MNISGFCLLLKLFGFGFLGCDGIRVGWFCGGGSDGGVGVLVDVWLWKVEKWCLRRDDLGMVCKCNLVLQEWKR